ncbi:efflux transporter outer membrane subunit [Pseudomonas sp. CMR5c]|uniref:efflux transporter outer membrane subunit n=1 Tax=Pseudomonas sp. CMR5c TaxID=658630 RepID=UPI0009FAF226|nr:efflux transporter outer membrane subunit [Pseudomonas sp. CMR5c]AZC18559.1 hypothetical protein C4K40_3171 [Pseudomonas sp. CMR5c]
MQSTANSTVNPMRLFKRPHRLALFFSFISTALLLCSCATKHVEQLSADPKVPAQWEAPMPDSRRATELKNWWKSQNEPELVTLIEAANEVSPNIASALARIERAKASQVQDLSSLLPELTATMSRNKSYSPLANGAYTQTQTGVQVSWALDLAKLNGSQLSGGRAGLESADAQWHDARILVAAEVADLYYASRICQRQSELYNRDAKSYERSVQMMLRSLQAGMAADGDLAAERYNAAQVMGQLQKQQATCELQIKGLVALTGQSEPSLRQLLQPAWQRPLSLASFSVSAIPAQALSQRPDVYVAELDVIQAQARVMQAQANRLPRLSLEGFVGRSSIDAGDVSVRNATSWTFGPLALNLPIFDAGRRAADQRAAEEDLNASISAYHARVRLAVREIEEALVQLDSADQRLCYSRVAAEQAAIRLQSSERLLQEGMLSPFELEELRRKARAAEQDSLALDLEGRRAWTTLYRAVGGGFDRSSMNTESKP